MRLNPFTAYIRPNGTPSSELMREAGLLEQRVAALEAKLAAMAAVTAPSGGATQDAEARTAINALRAGAG